MKSIEILLTNDDGILSPGLWAAAEALSELGFVHVVAPRQQASGTGRSMPATSDGIIQEHQVTVHGKPWTVYAVGGTPAQAVQHGVLEILPRPPDLVVSGINYGENLGNGVTISGTVGAALEASAMGFPALAVSLETEVLHHLSYSTDVDFSNAGYFARYFGRLLLARRLPPDVGVLKVDIPLDATPQTSWQITRLSRKPYYAPVPPERASWDTPVVIGYQQVGIPAEDDPDSDVYAMRVKRVVSVTPLSLDMTSRIDLAAFEDSLRNS
jgi:5'/3'-nucleotidase